MIARQAVSSSNLAEVGYEPSTRTLDVLFHSGRIYRYDDVPERTYRELIAAPSVGGYFASKIKSAYAFKDVT